MFRQIVDSRLLSGLIIFCCISFCGRSCSASINSKTEEYIRDIGNGVKYSFNDPMWLIYAGGIGGLSRFDDDIRDRFKGRLLPGKLSYCADIYGHGLNWLIGNSYILGEYLSTDRSKNDFNQYIKVYNEAFFVNMAFTYAFKTVVRRERPGKQNYRSFPSGHTSGSFVVAAVLYRLYGYQIGLPAYTMATITGLQRIHDDKHWLSDVLTGALLGTLIGNGFAELINNNDNKKTGKKFVASISIRF
ncbi:phosphatase PAP2 family protein [candidate division KSB1 bacterium]|nr:phosphatase PAP2 family protein [candidate division KSB1 bacterium]